MLHPLPAERRRDRAKRRILDATLELVREHGVGALTVHQIAAAADYTAGALYRYYPSKGALLGALVERELVAIHGDLLSALGTRTEPVDRLLTIARTLRTLRHERPAAAVLIRATLADPVQHVRDDEAVHIGAVQALLLTISVELAGATAAGALSPGDPGARALRWVFAILGIQQLDKIARFDDRLDPDPLIEALSRDLLVAWGAERAALEEK